MRKKPISSKFYVYSLSLCLIVVGFNNCGKFESIEEESIDSDPTVFTLAPDNVDDAPTGNGNIKALANTRTAAIVRGGRALDSLVSCLGTNEASAAARNEWNQNKGSLSTEGDANSISAPMLASLLKVSAEVCNDLVQSEKSMANGQRRVFSSVDFSQGPSSVDAFKMGDITRRLARSCWGRNETDGELQDIESAVENAFANSPDNSSETEKKLVFLCTAVAGAFATFSM